MRLQSGIGQTAEATPTRFGSGQAGGRRPRPLVPSWRDSWASMFVLGSLVGVLTWITPPLQPSSGLDPSWTAALHMSAHGGLDWGREVSFTFGPLGFLTAPRLFYAGTGSLALTWVALSHMTACVALLHVLRSRLPLVAAAALGYIAAALNVVSSPEAQVALAAALGLLMLEGKLPRMLVPVVPPALGLLAAAEFLMKFGVGLVMAVIAVLLAAGSPRAARSIVVTLAAMCGGLGILWTIAQGLPDADAVAFARQSLDFAGGYASAMSLEAAPTGAHVLMALVGAALLVVAFRSSSSPCRALRAAIVGVACFAAFKQGFVRHDPPHAVTFFFAVWLLATALARSGTRTALVVSCSLLTFSFMVSDVTWQRLSPVNNIVALADHAHLAVSASYRQSKIDSSRARLQRRYRLLPEALALLDRQTVHIDPWEATVAWAYPQLRWRPLPVFQSYAAYATSLDMLNARFLRSKGAPTRIVRETARSVDGRNPDFESPEAMRALVCSYRQLFADQRWQVLERTADRCGQRRLLGSSAAGDGRQLLVPGGGGEDEMVVAEFRGLQRTLFGKLESFFYKPSDIRMVLEDGRRLRFVPGTAEHAHVLSLPGTAGFSPRFGFSQPVRSFRLMIPHGWSQNVRVDFYGVRWSDSGGPG